MSIIESNNPWIITRWYEVNKDYYNLAKDKQKNHDNKFQIFNTNFFSADISDANIIYCYLMPHLMKSVRKKIKKECKSWTILYSNSFKIPKIKTESILRCESDTKFLNIIYVYKV